MANARAGSVIRVDTTGYSYSGPATISAIRFIGSTSATASINELADGSGMKIWEEAGTANTHSADIDVKLHAGFNVSVANGAVVYIYLCGD